MNGVVHAFALLFAASGLMSCSADTTGDPSPEKNLSDLSGVESESLCQWSNELVEKMLPPEGVALTCHGSTASFKRPSLCLGIASTCLQTPGNGYVCSMASESCSASVADYRACVPKLIDKIAKNPCDGAAGVIHDRSFIDSTSDCNGLAECGLSVGAM